MTDLFGDTCPCCGQTVTNAIPSPFDDFWQCVPHKIGKASAMKAWGKLSAAQRDAAKSNVVGWYAWFSKTYPTASPVHPATYMNGRRWEDEWSRPQSVDVKARIKSEVDRIKSGKRFLCGSISQTSARALIDMGHVTEDECRSVGVI
jgi:hypothetical protein